MADILLISALAAVGAFVVLWIVSLLVKDSSIVDPFWGSSFVLIAWVAWVAADETGTRQTVLLALVTIWGLRLTLYLAVRNLGKGEDYRYQAMRRRWGARFPLVSLGTVFLLQATISWVVSLPVMAAMGNPGELGWPAYLGMGIWVIGIIFEAGGDWQLARFKADSANSGQVMDRGLWRYTRHPNYFGDFTVWWGLFLISVTGPGMAWTVIGPLIMSYMLLRVSGVAMLERTIGKRRPGYEEYVQRTNAFFPWQPKP